MAIIGNDTGDLVASVNQARWRCLSVNLLLLKVLTMKCLDDFRLKLGQRDYVPIMIGGMGVDISSAALALEAARLGGIGHISDAMAPTVSDRRFKTKFTRDKFQTFKSNFFNMDKSSVQFDLGQLAEAHGSQERRRRHLHQLHGKADHERQPRDPARTSEGCAGCRH